MATAYDGPADSSEKSLFRSLDWFTITFLALLWAIYGVWAYSYKQTHFQAAEQELNRQRSVITEDVESFLNLSKFFLASANLWLADHPEIDPRSDSRFIELVEAFEQVNKNSMVVRMAAEDGTLHLAQRSPQEKQANVADRDYFIAAMNSKPGDLYLSAPFKGRVTGRWQIAVATRLAKPTHGISVIFVAIEISLFDEVFKNVGLSEGGIVAILRRDGILLARSASAAQPSVSLGIDLSNSPLFQKGLPHADSGFVKTDSPLTDKTPRLLAYTTLPDYPVVVTVGASLNQINETMLPSLLMIAGFLAILSLFTLAYRSRIRHLLNELADNRQLLAKLAMFDQLTETRNRHCFLELSNDTINRAKRYNESLALIILDIDHFKKINDTFGHPAGDFALHLLSQACQSCLRNVDTMGRLGGEEFGILLPNTGIDGATELARRIREHIESLSCHWNDEPIQLTVSLGLTEFHTSDTDFADLYNRADKALYQAKSSGRNQLCTLLKDQSEV